jgi:hypothetical protein
MTKRRRRDDVRGGDDVRTQRRHSEETSLKNERSLVGIETPCRTAHLSALRSRDVILAAIDPDKYLKFQTKMNQILYRSVIPLTWTWIWKRNHILTFKQKSIDNAAVHYTASAL